MTVPPSLDSSRRPRCDSLFQLTCLRLIRLAVVEHAPGDTGQLVSQRHHQHAAVQSFGCRLQPATKTIVGPVLRSHQNDPGTLDEKRPEMLVATLGDAAQDGSVSRRHLPGHNTEPSAKVTPAPESRTITNRRDHGAGDQRTDPWDCHQSLAIVVAFDHSLDLAC